MRRIMLMILGASLVLVPALGAQEGGRYRNPDLGIAFDVPEGWQVEQDTDVLTIVTPAGREAVQNGAVPDDLVVRIILGSFLELGLQRASDLPGQLSALVPRGTTAPEPEAVDFGNRSGWQVEYTVDDSELTTRVGLIGLENGRLALLRGFASNATWEESAALLDELKASLEFFTPRAFENPFADLPDRDGGVLWQYQAPQPADAAPITLGGITFDPFRLLYVAAGQRGILVLDETNGAFVNYLGPFFNDDNLTDIVISRDARLFVANATPGDNNQIMVVNRAGSYEYGFGVTGDGPGQFAPGMPRSLAITRNDEIWTISEGHGAEPTDRLYRFDRFGNLLDTIDLADINPDLDTIYLDNNVQTSALYLVGESGGLNLLDSDGSPLVTHLALEVFAQTRPVDIAIAPNDNIIIATDTQGILEFAPSGALLDRFGIPYDATRTDRFQPGETLTPAGLVVGVDGTLFFSETNPQSGFSQVQAFSFTGDGNLSLPNRPGSGQGAAQGPALVDPSAGGGNITYGATVQGSLNNQFNAHDWFFEAQAGDRIRVTMRDISPEQSLDPRIELISPNQNLLAENDDHTGNAPDGFRPTDSVLEYEIEVTGFYTLRATRFGGRGAYEMTLEQAAP
ncbi:MAG: hypothetical protein ACLFTK_05980 [Anaerolineales bacterium]